MWGSSAPAASSGWYAPSRGSIRRSVTTVTTRAMKNDDTIENQRFAVTVSGSVPGTSPSASFVISVTRLSIGVIRTLTAKTALTPA